LPQTPSMRLHSATIDVSGGVQTCLEPDLHGSLSRDCGRESTPALLQRRRLGKSLKVDCAAAKAELDEALGSAPNSELTRLTEDYELLEVLGHGSMSVVRRIRRRSGAMEEAALKTTHHPDPEQAIMSRAEFDMLHSLRHPSILRAYDIYSTPLRTAIAMELFPGPTLEKAVQELPEGGLPEKDARSPFAALLDALAYLHARCIVHRDLKAQNVLVLPDFSDLRLIDFNMATCSLERGTLSVTGTSAWKAPEVLLGQAPEESSGDMWAVGLCLHFMLFGRLLQKFERFHSVQDYARAVSTAACLEGQPWQQVSTACLGTLRACLDVDASRRAEAAHLLSSSNWLK